jgi:[ribosomal protein S18]-alanine N-acetyltransferase
VFPCARKHIDRLQLIAEGTAKSLCRYNALVSAATIRRGEPKDIDALLALERAAPTSAHWSRAQYEAIFSPNAPSRLCLVAENGPVQAFLVAQTAGPEWELENIVVASAARCQGLGTQLLHGLLQRARQQHAVAILLEVRASNAAARALYQGCGFVEAGARPLYYQNPQEDAIICRYNLQNPA